MIIGRCVSNINSIISTRLGPIVGTNTYKNTNTDADAGWGGKHLFNAGCNSVGIISRTEAGGAGSDMEMICHSGAEIICQVIIIIIITMVIVIIITMVIVIIITLWERSVTVMQNYLSRQKPNSTICLPNDSTSPRIDAKDAKQILENRKVQILMKMQKV